MSELVILPRAARRLGVPVKWLREQADAGKVPCLRAGARYLFDLDAVRQELAKQAAESRQGVDHAD
jgi:hypothetical protein